MNALIKIAANLVLGRYSLPYHQEDYTKRVPKWMLRKIEEQHNNHRLLSIAIKNLHDNLRIKQVEAVNNINDLSTAIKEKDAIIVEQEEVIDSLVLARRELKGLKITVKPYAQ